VADSIEVLTPRPNRCGTDFRANALRFVQRSILVSSFLVIDPKPPGRSHNINVLDQPFATGGRHWPRRVETAESIEVEEMAAYVKGFGCRPGSSERRSIGAGVGKPPKNEPAGRR